MDGKRGQVARMGAVSSANPDEWVGFLSRRRVLFRPANRPRPARVLTDFRKRADGGWLAAGVHPTLDSDPGYEIRCSGRGGMKQTQRINALRLSQRSGLGLRGGSAFTGRPLSSS